MRTPSVGVHEKGDISIEKLLRLMKSNKRFKQVGALACFMGYVRGFTHEGKRVKTLELEAYGERTEEVFREIAQKMKSRPGVVEVFVHHVAGRLRIGDLILFVAVAGRSRRDVFPALVETVERVKLEAPIWKKETLTDGRSRWVEYQ